jgi:hypothetical protein
MRLVQWLLFNIVLLIPAGLAFILIQGNELGFLPISVLIAAVSWAVTLLRVNLMPSLWDVRSGTFVRLLAHNQFRATLDSVRLVAIGVVCFYVIAVLFGAPLTRYFHWIT